jgi:prevent-host-death family protein
MGNINLADAKSRLSELVERAVAGDTVSILRRGKPVAQITAISVPRKPVDIKVLRALTATMPRQSVAAKPLIRMMREESRY